MTDNQPLKIAVASGKGGTGKTLVAVNLASMLSETQNTLLVDLDVEEPNDALFIHGTEGRVGDHFRLVPKWDKSKCVICDVCSSACKFHAVVRLGDIIAVFDNMCHSCHACSELCPQDALPMVKHKTGEIRYINKGRLTLIEGRLTAGEEQAVPLIKKTQELACFETDWTPVRIFDCPPGTSCSMVASVKCSDFVILVTEPTPFGLNDLILAVRTVRQLNKPVGVIINRYGIGNDDLEAWCKKENLDILACIPYDREIARLTSEGEMVYDKTGYMKPLLKQTLDKIMRLSGKG